MPGLRGPRSGPRRQGRRRALRFFSTSLTTPSAHPSNRSRKSLASFAPLGPNLSGGFFCARGSVGRPQRAKTVTFRWIC